MSAERSTKYSTGAPPGSCSPAQRRFAQRRTRRPRELAAAQPRLRGVLPASPATRHRWTGVQRAAPWDQRAAPSRSRRSSPGSSRSNTFAPGTRSRCVDFEMGPYGTQAAPASTSGSRSPMIARARRLLRRACPGRTRPAPTSTVIVAEANVDLRRDRRQHAGAFDASRSRRQQAPGRRAVRAGTGCAPLWQTSASAASCIDHVTKSDRGRAGSSRSARSANSVRRRRATSASRSWARPLSRGGIWPSSRSTSTRTTADT